MTYCDVDENLSHYFDMMLRGDEEILYTVGPYLCKKYDYYSFIDKIKKITNLEYLLCMSEIEKCTKNVELSVAKAHIRTILSKVQSLENNDLSKLIIDKCIKTLDELRQLKIQDKLMESAIINYAPIVPYVGTLRKPMESDDENKNDQPKILSMINQSKEKIQKEFCDVFINHIDEIIQSSDRYITYIHDLYSQALSSKTKISAYYFSLVYVFYNVDKADKLSDVLSEIFKQDASLNYENILNVQALYESFLTNL